MTQVSQIADDLEAVLARVADGTLTRDQARAHIPPLHLTPERQRELDAAVEEEAAYRLMMRAARRLDAKGLTPEDVLAWDPHRGDPEKRDIVCLHMAGLLASIQGGRA